MPTGTTWWNNFFDGTGDAYAQFISYLNHTNSLDELKYVFDPKKIGSNAETFIKNQFKDLFVSKAEIMFNTLGDAKMKQLFELPNFRFNNATEFKAYLNNPTFRNNALKFIKKE